MVGWDVDKLVLVAIRQYTGHDSFTFFSLAVKLHMDSYNARTSYKAVDLFDQPEGTIDSLALLTVFYPYSYLLLIRTAPRALHYTILSPRPAAGSW
jgi:hypothetical protein